MFTEDVDKSPKYGAAPIKMPFKLAGAPLPTSLPGARRERREANPFPWGDRARVTPEQVIEHCGWSGRRGHYQGFLLTVTCVTIASEAAEVALLSLILPHIRAEFSLSAAETDRVAMSIFFGQMLGCFVMGALADRLGRKPCGVVANALVAVGGYVSAIAPSASVLMLCRFFVGLGVGAAFVPVDMLAEACPDNLRSSKTQIANLSFSIGVVAITVVGMWMLDPLGWRVLAFVTAVPPTIALAMSLYLDESPTWLAERGKCEKAKRALNRVCVENTGRPLPKGVRIVASESEPKHTETSAGGESGETSERGVVDIDDASIAKEISGGSFHDEDEERAGGKNVGPSASASALSPNDHLRASSAFWNLVGTPTNFARTVCLWTLAFVQTFNFYGLMLHSPTVFRKTSFLLKPAAPGEPLVKVENVSKIAFDYPAILVVNSGDIVGNLAALLALRVKINPRWVAATCAFVSVPLLFTPLSETLRVKRWGLVFVMLLGRIPAAPIGAMSWILNAVAYPTLFRATGHGYANAVARFGAVAASSMYSASPAVSIPIHAAALLVAVPAALFAPRGSLETQGGASGVLRRSCFSSRRR
jgi:MFS family permease